MWTWPCVQNPSYFNPRKSTPIVISNVEQYGENTNTIANTYFANSLVVENQTQKSNILLTSKVNIPNFQRKSHKTTKYLLLTCFTCLIALYTYIDGYKHTRSAMYCVP